MAVNPMQLLKLKERLGIFQSQHPKVLLFLKNVGGHAAREGAVIELKVTDPDGQSHVTNMKVTKEDVETIQLLRNLQ